MNVVKVLEQKFIVILQLADCCGVTGVNIRNLGVEFGEYSLRQYRYAKEYYRIVKEELQKLEDE